MTTLPTQQATMVPANWLCHSRKMARLIFRSVLNNMRWRRLCGGVLWADLLDVIVTAVALQHARLRQTEDDFMDHVPLADFAARVDGPSLLTKVMVHYVVFVAIRLLIQILGAHGTKAVGLVVLALDLDVETPRTRTVRP